MSQQIPRLTDSDDLRSRSAIPVEERRCPDHSDSEVNPNDLVDGKHCACDPAFDPIYADLDANLDEVDDEDPFPTLRFSPDEIFNFWVFPNRDYWEVLGRESERLIVMLYSLGGIGIGIALLCVHFLVILMPPFPVIDIMIGWLRSVPIFTVPVFFIPLAAAGYYWSWKSSHARIFSECFIVGGRFVDRVWLPDWFVVNRADHMSAGERVMYNPQVGCVENCALVDTTCAHDPKLIFESDIEYGVPSASVTYMNRYRRQYVDLLEISELGKRSTWVEQDEGWGIAKLLPWATVHLLLFGLAFLLIMADIG